MRLLAGLSTAVAAGLVVALASGLLRGRPVLAAVDTEPSARQQWLIQAGLDLTPRQFAAGSAAIGVVALGLFTLITGVVAVALAPAVLAALAPRLYFSRARDRRMSEIQRAWPDGIRDLTASISAGMSLQRALEQLASGGPIPLRLAFERFPQLARTVGVAAALDVIKAELADPTSDRVIEVLILAHQRGGSVVLQILRDLSEATARDLWTLEAIQTEALEQKINARAVFALPWLVLVAVTARAGEFRDFYASRAGLVVVAMGAVMSGLGMLLVSRLGQEPDEPRVLAGSVGEAT